MTTTTLVLCQNTKKNDDSNDNILGNDNASSEYSDSFPVSGQPKKELSSSNSKSNKQSQQINYYDSNKDFMDFDTLAAMVLEFSPTSYIYNFILGHDGARQS